MPDRAKRTIRILAALVVLLAVGAGATPFDWTVIDSGTTPVTEDIIPELLIDGEASLNGTLGTWPTGLTEYPYPFDPYARDMGVEGVQTVRLRVFDVAGGYAEDSITVRIGTVIGRAFASRVTSEDGRLRLEASAFAASRDFSLAAIVPDGPADQYLLYHADSLSFDPPALLSAANLPDEKSGLYLQDGATCDIVEASRG